MPQVLEATVDAGLTFLFTLLPNGVVDGACTDQPNSPCRFADPYPLSSFCRATVAGLVPPSVKQPRPGKTTVAQLERTCEVAFRLATKFGKYGPMLMN